MTNIEQLVKAQYAKVYDASDWQLFKRTAEARRIGTVWSSGFALLSPTYELRGNDNSEAVG